MISLGGFTSIHAFVELSLPVVTVSPYLEASTLESKFEIFGVETPINSNS